MKKLAAVLLSVLAVVGAHGQVSHGHLNIGAVGTNPGDALDFDNGNIFATDSGYVMTLAYTNGGTYAGYYQGNITLTVLAATAERGGPIPGAPALGSMIYAQIVSVEGPSGGAFGFWDTGATNPTISVASGTTGTNVLKVSENNGSAGSDPFGHIHGRRFTATKPGLYVVSFRAIDKSSNGPGGGPIHSPSDVLKIYFQAGVSIASLNVTNGIAAVTFGAPGGKICTLEYATAVPSGNWISINAVTGADALQTLNDPGANGTARFYRVRVE